MPGDYLPATDGGLNDWAANFGAQITADAPDLGITPEEAGGFTVLQTDYATKYAAATNPETRGRATVLAKNTAKRLLVRESRKLAMKITNNPGVTDQQRNNLGLTVRDDDPSPVAVPDTSPIIEVVSVKGNRISLRLRVSANGEPVSGRGKPTGVTGATVLSYVGEQPPTEISDWKFEGSTTRTSVLLDMPASLAAGSKVWLTAFWFNRKSQSGPATQPVSTSVLGGAVG